MMENQKYLRDFGDNLPYKTVPRKLDTCFDPGTAEFFVQNDSVSDFGRYFFCPSFKLDRVVYINGKRSYLIDVAALFGSIKCFELLLSYGASISETTIEYSIIGGCFDIITLIVSMGFSYDKYLDQAVRYGFNDIADWIMEKYSISDISITEAVKGGNIEAVAFCLDSGVDINLRDNTGNTPLIYSIKNNHIELSKYLLEKGADVNIGNGENQIPLVLAIKTNNRELYSKIIEYGVDFSQISERGMSLAAYAYAFGSENIYNELLRLEYDMYQITGKGNLPIEHALENGHIDIVLLSLNSNYDWKRTNMRGLNLMHLLCHYDYYKPLHSLLLKDVDTEIKSSDGHTPLHICVLNGSTRCFERLIEVGANINTQDKDKKTPLIDSLLMGNFYMANILLNEGADVRIKDVYGRNCLYYASMSENQDIISSILSRNIDINDLDITESSPIFAAVQQQNINTCEHLLSKGACPNLINKAKDTVLSLACSLHNYEICRLLIEFGASLDLKPPDGKSAFDIAKKNDDKDIIKLFCSV